MVHSEGQGEGGEGGGGGGGSQNPNILIHAIMFSYLIGRSHLILMELSRKMGWRDMYRRGENKT